MSNIEARIRQLRARGLDPVEIAARLLIGWKIVAEIVDAIEASAETERDPEPPAAPAPTEHPGHQEPVGCRWIDGDTRGSDWRFCQQLQRPGSSYCDEHHRRCYEPAGRRGAA